MFLRKWSLRTFICLTLAISSLFSTANAADKPWIAFEGGRGIGSGKHVVLVSGDEEYRSEEAMPMLAKILSKHFGFRCTVLHRPKHKCRLPGRNISPRPAAT